MLKAFDTAAPSLASQLFPSFMQKRPDPVQQLSTELRPLGHSTDDIRRWILGIVDSHGVTATEWARVSELAPSTLNRFIANTQSSANLSARTIDSLNLGIRKILYNRNEGDFFQKEIYRLSYASLVTVDIPMIGVVATRQLENRAKEDQFAGRRFSVPVMYEESKHSICAFGLVNEYQNIYVTGTILICRPVFGKRPPIISRARYIYHRKHDDGTLDARLYDFLPDPRGNYWLLPLRGREKVDSPLYIGRWTRDESVDVPGRATFLVIGHVSPNAALQMHHIEGEREEYERRRDEEAEQERERDDQIDGD